MFLFAVKKHFIALNELFLYSVLCHIPLLTYSKYIAKTKEYEKKKTSFRVAEDCNFNINKHTHTHTPPTQRRLLKRKLE